MRDYFLACRTMKKRLEEIVAYFNEEVFAEPQYSLTWNDEKAIVLGHEGDICNGILIEIIALAYAYGARVEVYAHDSAPYLEITF